MNLNVFKFLFNVSKSNSPCIQDLKMFFIYNSKLTEDIEKMVYKKFGFQKLLDNDWQAVVACVRRKQSEYVSNIPYEWLLNRPRNESFL